MQKPFKIPTQPKVQARNGVIQTRLESQKGKAELCLMSLLYIQLFQKMLSGRTTNVNCRTAIARLKRNVGIEY